MIYLSLYFVTGLVISSLFFILAHILKVDIVIKEPLRWQLTLLAVAIIIWPYTLFKFVKVMLKE